MYKKIVGSPISLIVGILLAAYGGVQFVQLAVLPRLGRLVG